MAAWCSSTAGWRCCSSASNIICRFPHCCRRTFNWQHGVGPRSPGLAVGPQERPLLPADPLHRAGEDRGTVPDSHVHSIRCHSAQTEEDPLRPCPDCTGTGALLVCGDSDQQELCCAAGGARHLRPRGR